MVIYQNRIFAGYNLDYNRFGIHTMPEIDIQVAAKVVRHGRIQYRQTANANQQIPPNITPHRSVLQEDQGQPDQRRQTLSRLVGA